MRKQREHLSIVEQQLVVFSSRQPSSGAAPGSPLERPRRR